MKTAHERRNSRVLDWLVFFYVFSVLVFPTVPVLSRLSLLLTGAIGCVLLIRYGKNGSLFIPKWIVFPILFLLYAIASVLWSADPVSAIQSSFSLVSAVAGALVFWVALLSGASWQAVVLSCFLSGVTIIVSALPELVTAESNMRISGILGNPNGLALHLTMTAFVLFASPHKKGMYGVAGVCFIVFATVFSGSIKMLLFWAVFLIYGASRLLNWSRKSYLNQSLLIVICLLFIAIPLYAGSFLVDNLEDLTVTKRFLSVVAGENTSGNTRLEMLEEALRLWMDKPIVGNGIDQVRVLGSHGTYSHNNYAEMLANFGLIGTILFYLSDGALLYACIKRVFSKNKLYLLVLVITITSFLWDFALVSYQEKSAWLLMAVSFYLIQMAETESQTPRTQGVNNSPKTLMTGA